jgi:hypothetical protein
MLQCALGGSEEHACDKKALEKYRYDKQNRQQEEAQRRKDNSLKRLNDK